MCLIEYICLIICIAMFFLTSHISETLGFIGFSFDLHYYKEPILFLWEYYLGGELKGRRKLYDLACNVQYIHLETLLKQVTLFLRNCIS